MEIVASQSGLSIDTEIQDPALLDAATEGRYIRIRGWFSRFLSSPHDLFLYLPKTYYEQPERRFPLLVMQDGQNLFDGNLSFVKGSTWRVAQTADQEIASGRVESVVIAGVSNAGVERIAEYTPTPDRTLGGGKGPQYAQMLRSELLPMLRSRYRILPGAETTGLMGSSLGGLISLATGMRYSDTFQQIGVLSPSVWWDGRAILKDIRSLAAPLPLRIWLDIGTGEGQQAIRDTDLLAGQLQATGWEEGQNLMYRRFPGAAHNEAAWADRLAQVLQFLYPGSELPLIPHSEVAL